MLIAFFVWRLADLFISFIASIFIPYLGFFPYKEILQEYGLPSIITAFANFDGAQYITLVREGYNTYTQAYFPLYFLTVKAVSFLLPTPGAARPHNDLIAALIVSNGFFLIGLVVFKKYLHLLFPNNNTSVFWVILFLLLFPTSFFFGAVYTEGLFFFLFISSLYFLKRKIYWCAGLFAALSSATRLMGVFLIIPFLFHFWELKTPKNLKLKTNGLVVFAPFVGFVCYAVYLWITTGDPLFFFHAQPAFGANRSTSLVPLPQVYYRYAKILLTATPNFQYFVSLVEMLFFSFVFMILVLDLIKNLKLKIKNYELIGLNLFSFANILLPTLTGTFSSLPRYALFSLSFFLFLGRIKNVPFKYAVGALFIVFHIVLLAFFVQGYFVG